MSIGDRNGHCRLRPPQGGDNECRLSYERTISNKMLEYRCMLPTAEESGDLCIESFCPYRHLGCMERVLHHHLGVDLVHLL